MNFNWHQGVQRVSERSARAGRAAKWLSPGMGVKRYLTALVLSLFILINGFVYYTWTGPLNTWTLHWIIWLNRLTRLGRLPAGSLGGAIALLALASSLWSIWMLSRSLLKSTGVAPNQAADRIYSNRALARGPRWVALGGGTGLSNLLSGLKEYSSNITAVVAVTDDGGSSGRLRRDLDMIAPGDLTDCYAALSDTPALAELLLHRFSRGEGLAGHTFGNLMLATLSEQRGDLREAVEDVNEILNVRGQVLPATTQSAVLVAELEDGSEVRGESQLHLQRGDRRVRRVRLDPADVPAPPAVTEAIARADAILIGPGSLLTSLIPAILVPGIREAIQQTAAPLIYVANIMSEAGETDGLGLEEHHQLLAAHLGRSADVILVNKAPLREEVLARYREEGASPLQVPKQPGPPYRLADLVTGRSGQHDPALLAKELWLLLKRREPGRVANPEGAFAPSASAQVRR